MSSYRLLPNNRILRYTLSERILHWIVGLTYVHLLLTGLAFYMPQLYWLAVVLGGGQTSRIWHPLIGVIFTIGMFWMYAIWRRDMRMVPVDKEWGKALKYYIRNEDENVPPAGRFNAGQKQFFWLMLFSTILLLLSGLVLWFTEYVSWEMRILRFVAVFVHVGAFLVSFGLFIIHFYMGTAVVRQGFTSVVRGEVSKSWARRHHPLWLREMEGEVKK